MHLNKNINSKNVLAVIFLSDWWHTSKKWSCSPKWTWIDADLVLPVGWTVAELPSVFSDLLLSWEPENLLFVRILGNMMEAGAVLLLLLLQLGTLCVTSDTNFYGNSVNFMAQKRNKDGTFTVGIAIFLFHNLLKEIKPINKQLV